MEHKTELELIEYTTSRIDPSRATAIEDHLALCDSCRRICDETRLVYDSLDELSVPEVGDLTLKIRNRIALKSHKWNWFAARIAAVVIFSALIGFLAAVKFTAAQPDSSIIKNQTDISFVQPARHIALAVSGEIK